MSRRISYAEAGRAMRYSSALARGATPAERVMLAAVHHWTVSYSKSTDRVSLGQLAVVAGLWDGPARDCPRSITRRVGQRLRRLHDLGAITYQPGGGEHGRGYLSTVSVTLDPRDQNGDPDETPSDEKGDTERDPFEDQKGDPARPEGGPTESRKGDPVDPPPEKSSEKSSEKPAANPSVVPTAQDEHAAAAADEDQILAEAHRRWTRRRAAGEQLGAPVLRLIEQDVRDEWANRQASAGVSERELIESYARLGQNRARLGVTEDDLQAELAGDPNLLRIPDLMHAALCGLRGEQVIH